MEERTARRGRQELRFETKRIVVPIRKDSNGVSEKSARSPAFSNNSSSI